MTITIHGCTYTATGRHFLEGEIYSNGKTEVIINERGEIRTARNGFQPINITEECDIRYSVDESKYDLTGYALLD